MRKAILVTACIVFAFFVQASSGSETEKPKDKQIEELSGKAFYYADIDGKQSLTLTTEPQEDWYKKRMPQPCENNIAVLRKPAAALSIPGTSLILAFLDCPAWQDVEISSIVALFNRNDTDNPLCFSRLKLMDDNGSYYYGIVESLQAREAGDKAYYVVVKCVGGDAGDSWTSLAFLHIDITCRITVLSKLYASFHYNYNEGPGKCSGSDMECRFLDDHIIEVTTRDLGCPGEDSVETLETTKRKYDLRELVGNPQSRVFSFERERNLQ